MTNRKARIDVVWPASADRDGWKINEVVAIDDKGIAHMVEIIGVSVDVELRRRKKH